MKQNQEKEQEHPSKDRENIKGWVPPSPPPKPKTTSTEQPPAKEQPDSKQSKKPEDS